MATATKEERLFDEFCRTNWRDVVGSVCAMLHVVMETDLVCLADVADPSAFLLLFISRLCGE